MLLLLLACTTEKPPPVTEDDSGVVDTDGDGSPFEEDCDDADPGVHAGAPETCDGVDQDCDGVADEEATDASAWYADTDADGYGDGTSAVQSCTRPVGYVSDATDCDDGEVSTYPGAAEWCDGADQDCDGVAEIGRAHV